MRTGTDATALEHQGVEVVHGDLEPGRADDAPLREAGIAPRTVGTYVRERSATLEPDAR